MKKQKNICFLIIFGLALAFILLPYMVLYLNPTSQPENDLLSAETLPENQLDRMLIEKGIDLSIIKALPVWEKQYLIDWDVDFAYIKEEPEETNHKYKKINEKAFSMQVIVARIWSEKDKNPYPMYRVIIPYRWENLPVWTGNDDLTVVFGDSWLPESHLQVDYIRNKNKLKHAVKNSGFYYWNNVGIQWKVDIKRKFGNTQKDGYVAVTLRRPYNYNKNTNEVIEIQACYAHNIVIPSKGVSLVGQNIEQDNSLWRRYCFIKEKIEFSQPNL